MLYFIPTPIGNLSDISQHSLEVLKSCEILICEDTRISKNLLNLLSQKYSISFNIKEFYSLHTHNEKEFEKNFDICNLKNKNCAYVSDAGMPCISDPGVFLIKFAQDNNIDYEVLSGSNALLLAVAASGMIEKEFTFLGFLPNTGQDRKIAIQNALDSIYPVVIYESPKRIEKILNEICALDENRKIFLIKEATKKFETKIFGNVKEILEKINTFNLNGEWCIVIDKSKNLKKEFISVDDILSLEIPPKQKAKLISKITGENSKKIYESLIK